MLEDGVEIRDEDLETVRERGDEIDLVVVVEAAARAELELRGIGGLAGRIEMAAMDEVIPDAVVVPDDLEGPVARDGEMRAIREIVGEGISPDLGAGGYELRRLAPGVERRLRTRRPRTRSGRFPVTGDLPSKNFLPLCTETGARPSTAACAKTSAETAVRPLRIGRPRMRRW
jgi:hypothetical protein